MDVARPHHLFVVEDDTAMRDMLCAYLEKQGLAVTGMATAEELMRRIHRLRPDLVVMDVSLPGESGLQACQRLRAEGDRVPIILLTARTEEIDRVLGLEMGADDYLGKPFSARELLARIRAVLRRASHVPGLPLAQGGPVPIGQFQFEPATRSLVGPDGDIRMLSTVEYTMLVELGGQPERGDLARKAAGRQPRTGRTPAGAHCRRGRDAPAQDRRARPRRAALHPDRARARLHVRAGAAPAGNRLNTPAPGSGRPPLSLVRRLTGGMLLITMLSFAAQALLAGVWLRPVADDLLSTSAALAIQAQSSLQALHTSQRPALARQLSQGSQALSLVEPAPGPPPRRDRPVGPGPFGGFDLSGPVGLGGPPADSMPAHGPRHAELDEVRARLATHGISARLQPRGGGRIALVFRLPVDEQVWWLSRESAGPGRSVTNTLLVWLAVLALATLGALLLSVRLIARPLATLAQDIGRQHGALQALPLPPGASAEVQALVLAFNRLAEQAQAQAQARQQLLAGVSHDLRTPLARLRLRVETQCDEPVAQALTADLQALERIVNQFLAYVQGDSGALQGHPVPLADAVEEAVGPYVDQGQPVSLALEGGDALERPVSDLAVQRLLANLIDNALAYGQPPVEVQVRAGPRGVELRVTDQGPGMSEAEFLRAQRPFVRLGQARGQLGHCGLGLAIVARLGQQLGGRLEAVRDSDGRFSVSLHLPG